MSKLTELIEELTIDYFPDNYEWQDDQFNDKIQAIIDEVILAELKDLLTFAYMQDGMENILYEEIQKRIKGESKFKSQPETGINK